MKVSYIQGLLLGNTIWNMGSVKHPATAAAAADAAAAAADAADPAAAETQARGTG